MTTHYNMSCMSSVGRPFTISGYLGVDAAAGVYMNIDLNQPAVATSPTDVIVPSACRIVDIVGADNVGDTALLGTIEIVAGGQGTGIFVDVPSRGPGNAGRMPLNIPLRAGTQLRFKVVSAIDDT